MRRAPLATMLSFLGLLIFGAALPAAAQTRSPLKLKSPAEVERDLAEGRLSPRSVPAPPDVAAVPDDAERTPSGLATRILKAGSGSAKPRPTDWVGVYYSGWTTDGQTVHSTKRTGPPAWFPRSAAIPGLAEAIGLMVEGESRRVWIPEELAYGGARSKPRGMLVYDVELAGVRPSPEPPADLAAPPGEAVRELEGFAYRVLSPATGPPPGSHDAALVEFTVWRRDGSVVDSTVLRGEPISFNIDATLLGFRQALLGMAVGERRRLWLDEAWTRLPERDNPEVPGGAVVDLELIGVERQPMPPGNLLEPEPDAERTLTGLAWKQLAAGSGTRKPGVGSRVKVRFAGWTRDGKLFASSWEKGSASIFALDARMPPGWNEGLRSMVEGERRLLWIPADLGMPSPPDWPGGAMIFDVELLEILDDPPGGR